MIFDGRWKKELKGWSRSITLWRKMPSYSEVAEHRLTRAILYSTIILRKVTEDEVEAEQYAEKYGWKRLKCEVIHAEVGTMKFSYVVEPGRSTRGLISSSNYGKGETALVNAKDICNWLIHSYVWGLGCDSEKGNWKGFFVSSDRNKEECVYFISFEEWQRVIRLAVEKGAF